LPDFPEVRAAEKLLGQRQPEQAALILEPYCSRNPGNAQAWFLLGAAYHQTGQPEAALQALERAISTEPRHVQARSAKGAVLCDLGRHQEALQVYRKALHLSPADAQLLVNLGVVQEQLGDAPGALERYDQAIKSQPDFAAALLNRGALLIRLGRREQALANNRRLAERYPDWDAAQYNLGEALLASGCWNEALAAYERTLVITPAAAKTLFAKGLALSMLRRFDEAQHAFDSANSIDHSVVEQCIRTAASLSVGEVREIAPKVIYLLKGSQRLEDCDWTDRDEFVADFEALIENSPGRPDEITERALLYRTLSLPVSAAARLRLARNVSAHIVDALKSERQPVYDCHHVVHDRHHGGKLRIGYISPDFGGGLLANAGDITLVAASINDITLGANAYIYAGVGNVTLAAAGGNFVNNSGNTTPITAARTLIYSTIPTDDTLNGMTADFKRYNCTYAAGCLTAGTAIPATGNGFLYSYAPALAVTVDAQSKIYGAADPAFSYTVSGYEFGDDATTALSGTLGRAAGENVGSYAINQGTFLSPLGYTISLTGNNLGITPASLSVIANALSKVYGSADPALTYAATGFQFSDTVGTALTGSLSRIAGEVVGLYAINQGSLAANANYTVSYTGNNLDITVAPAPVAPVDVVQPELNTTTTSVNSATNFSTADEITGGAIETSSSDEKNGDDDTLKKKKTYTCQ
jgi:tetratricopeptide (TPR) repeat protein